MIYFYFGLTFILLVMFIVLSITWDLHGMILFKTGKRSKKQIERSKKLTEKSKSNGLTATSASNFRIGDTAFNEVGIGSFYKASVNDSDVEEVKILENIDELDETMFIEIAENFSKNNSENTVGIQSDDIYKNQKVSEKLNKNSKVVKERESLIDANVSVTSKNFSSVNISNYSDDSVLSEPVEETEFIADDGYKYHPREDLRIGDEYRADGFDSLHMSNSRGVSDLSELSGEETEFLGDSDEEVTSFIGEDESETVFVFNTDDNTEEDEETMFMEFGSENQHTDYKSGSYVSSVENSDDESTQFIGNIDDDDENTGEIEISGDNMITANIDVLFENLDN